MRTCFAVACLQTSVVNTFVFTLGCLVLQFGIGFGLLAPFFNRESRLVGPARGVLMIPWMIPMTVTALMFKFMFSSNVGIWREPGSPGPGSHSKAHRMAPGEPQLAHVLSHRRQYLDLGFPST